VNGDNRITTSKAKITGRKRLHSKREIRSYIIFNFLLRHLKHTPLPVAPKKMFSSDSARFEQKECDLANVEVNEMTRFYTCQPFQDKKGGG
jgi:hypothetical protein